nr:spermatogenesis-associated protein 31E1-like [Odocoileus virginianus texanus]
MRMRTPTVGRLKAVVQQLLLASVKAVPSGRRALAAIGRAEPQRPAWLGRGRPLLAASRIKHRNCELLEHRKERRGRSRSSKRNGALKACRDCLETLEEVWDLTSLLQRHLGRFPDKGNFHQISCQDSPGEVCKAVPAGAHPPCREEAAPTISPAPLTKQPLPQASAISPGSVSTYSESYLSASPTPEPFFPLDSLSPSPPSPPHGRACPPPAAPCSAPTPSGSMLSLTQGDSTTRKLDTIPHRSSPHSPWRPAIPGLVHSSSPGSALAWWQEAATAWSFSTSTHLESQKESLPLYPPEASFWEDPRKRQVEAGGLAFINPNVQELLEILISKRVESMTQSADFQLAEIAWKHWRRSGT